VWLASWKRGANRPTVAYEEAVEEALCFGWIDSTVNTLDEERGLQLMTPRRPRSSWTRLNRERVARLEAEGRMTEAGRRAVVVAKHNGWWLLYDTVEDLLEPDELSAALDEVPQARAHWDAFPPVGAQADALVGRQCRQGRYAGSAGRGDRGQRRTGSARE
jgi:uncharacterized protein YdeI (YjbR/CyaY-like superfamily)